MYYATASTDKVEATIGRRSLVRRNCMGAKGVRVFESLRPDQKKIQ